MTFALDLLLRLVVAALCGCLIGLDRERLYWAAGMRTHMLVSLGSALFMLVSLFGFGDVLGNDAVMLDPSRVASQVVSGIGFLGAGTIILRQNVIKGLTTAASLWMVSAIGLAVGGGLYLIAVGTTLLTLLILTALKPLERRLFAAYHPQQLLVTLDREHASLQEIEKALQAAGLDFISLQLTSRPREDDHQVQVTVVQGSKSTLMAALDQLRSLPGVRQVSYDT
jgi:putative Mg2+ transporter-C (MgtC) family protein